MTRQSPAPSQKSTVPLGGNVRETRYQTGKASKGRGETPKSTMMPVADLGEVEAIAFEIFGESSIPKIARERW